MKTLERYTWDQACIAGLATPQGFPAIGIAAATVRRWASDGLVTAAGVAPNGAKLYNIADVSAVADRPKRRPGRPRRSGTLHPRKESRTLGRRR